MEIKWIIFCAKRPKNKLAEVIDFMEYVKLKEEIEATEDILEDKQLMDMIKASLDNVRQDKVYKKGQ